MTNATEKEVLTLTSIGTVEKEGERRYIRVDERYREALTGLAGFSHILVLWWADRFAEYRDQVPMSMELPYAADVTAGLFATRSPVRPNPIGLNTARIVRVDVAAGEVELDEIDAYAGTQVLDLKPYYGCIDRVKEYAQPEWVPADWGQWYEPLPEIDYGPAQ